MHISSKAPTPRRVRPSSPALPTAPVRRVPDRADRLEAAALAALLLGHERRAERLGQLAFQMRAALPPATGAAQGATA